MRFLLATFLLAFSLLAVAHEDDYQVGVLIISAEDTSTNNVFWLSTEAPMISRDGTWRFVDFCTDKIVVLSDDAYTNHSIRVTDIDEAVIMCSEG